MQSLQRKLLLLTTVLLTVAAVFVSVRAGQNFEQSLTSQALAVEREIGRSIIDVVQRALQHDVPFEGLVDADRYLEAVKRDNPRVEYLIVTGLDGRPRYSTDLSRLSDVALLQRAIAGRDDATSYRVGRYFNTPTMIVHRGQPVGYLHLGQRANIVEQLLWEIAFDIITVLVVASLVAFELVRPLLAASFSSPLRAIGEFFAAVAAGDFRRYMPRDVFGGIGRLSPRINAVVAALNSRARERERAGEPLPAGFRFDTPDERRTLQVNAIENIRWPFFLLIFAESLSLSFFPIFVGQFYDPAFGLPPQVVIGIPITIFMLVWALAMPVAGTWCDRVGYRQVFCFGAALTTVGLVLTAYANSLTELLLWRSITAVGYGAVYVTTQTYITVNIPADERTRGMAFFLASFFAGSLSGAAIGGILVDRLGFQMTFLLSAVLSAMAAVYVLQFLGTESVQASATSKKKLAMADFKMLLKHKQFAVIAFLSAVPAKIALAGFLYYSVPLYLKGLGHSQSVTGRVMMAYGLAIILVAPIVAALADRMSSRWRFVMIGGYTAAIAIMIPLYIENTTGAAIAVILLGIAHAVGVSPQMTLISDRCEEVVKDVGQATTVGIFRLVERIGTITGPILLGIMIALTDFRGAFVGLAVMTFMSTTAFTLSLLWLDRAAKPA